jgi:hypothetical protein
MTFGDLYANSQILWDKAAQPYMPPNQFDLFANIKYNDWAQFEADQIEQNVTYDAYLKVLFTTFTKNNSNYIDLVNDVNNYQRRLRFNLTYADPCNKGKSIQRSIDPVSNDDIDEMLQDPFNNPTDEYPASITTQLPNGNPGFLVYSTTTPLTLNMTYLRIPQVINSATSPNTVFEQPDWVTYMLLKLVVYRMDITAENINRAKAEIADASAK